MVVGSSGHALSRTIRLPPRVSLRTTAEPYTTHTQKDAVWALTKITKVAGGRDVDKTVGPKCDACYQMSLSFPLLEWQQLCERNTADNEFQSEVKNAAKVISGAPKDFQESTIIGGVEHAIDLTQKFTVVSEKQLERLSQRARLPKTIMRGVPTVELLSELGCKWEKFYVF